MKKTDYFLYIGIFVSLLLHFSFYEALIAINDNSVKQYKKSTYVPFEVKKAEKKELPPPEKKDPPPPPKPKPVQKPKPEQVSKTKEPAQQAPVSHVRKADPQQKIESDEEVKPVFGVTKDSVVEGQGGGIGVRVGNTLMKEQEAEYTPPEKVKDYFAGEKVEERKIDKNVKKFTKFEPVPVFKISVMPVLKKKVKAIYPEELRDEEIEGEVILTISIDKKGKVVKAVVKSSDNPLFNKPAIDAVKKCEFAPAKLENGDAADSVVDFTIIFELEF